MSKIENLERRLQIKQAEERLNEITSFSFDPEKFGVKVFLFVLIGGGLWVAYLVWAPMLGSVVGPPLEQGGVATSVATYWLTGSSAAAEATPRVLGWGILAFGGLKLWKWIRYSF